MYDHSGGTDQSRRQEARKILDMLKDVNTEQLRSKDAEFIESLTQRFASYGDRTLISPKTLFFLRNVKDRYCL